MTDTPAIPYDEIDIEIQSLVQLLNAIPGIRTCHSCAGHAGQHPDHTEAYVTFEADNQDAVKGLLIALRPVLEWQCGFVANRPQWQAITFDVGLSAEGAMWYSLRIFGAPIHAQRSVLGRAEGAIRELVSAGPPRSRHAPCSTCASDHSASIVSSSSPSGAERSRQ